jgi:hypothetical protein
MAAIIENRTPLNADMAHLVNSIRDDDMKLMMKLLNKDKNVIYRRYPTGWFGGKNTLLHVACYFNRQDMALKLLELGSDIEAKTAAGYTALMVACTCGFGDLAIELLEKGADVQAKENNNRSVGDLMHSKVIPDIEYYYNETERIREAARLREEEANRAAKEEEQRKAQEEAAAVEAEKQAKFEEEKSRIKERFDQADVDGGGTLDSEELREVCADLGLVLDDDELEAALAILDENGDGDISFEEFCDWWLF